MQTETDVQNLSILAIEQHGGGALRNNSGCLPREDGTPVRFGLGNTSEKFNREFKTGDLIGIYQGIFCMWECKPPGWHYTATPRERAQWNAIRWVRAHGGRAGFVTHPAQAVVIALGTGGGAYDGR